MGSSYYSPQLQRFIQQDSYSGDVDVPLSLNRYAYVGDSPTNLIDPTGHFSLATALLLGAVIGLTIVNVAQLGLDPATDALEAAAISDFVAGTAAYAATSAVAAAAAEGSPEFVDSISVDLPSLPEQRGVTAVAVIGRDSEDRVIPFVAQLSADLEGTGIRVVSAFETDAPNYSDRLDENNAWVTGLARAGVTIIDIGPFPLEENYPFLSGDFYATEFAQVAGYTDLLRYWIGFP